MTHPYMPLYVDDYEAATAHLTAEEDGVYSRLMRLCWRTPGCSLPNDPAWIARKIRLSVSDYERVARPVIEEFFKIVRGRLVQKRLKEEYDTISRKKSARVKAGKKGGDAKALKSLDKTPSNATDLPSDTRAFPEPTPEPEPEEVGGDSSAGEAIDDWPVGGAADHAALLCEAAGTVNLDRSREAGLTLTAGRLHAWRRDGASWDRDVKPVVVSLAAKARGPITSWKYFDRAVAEAKANGERELERIDHDATDRPGRATAGYAKAGADRRGPASMAGVLARQRGLG